MSLPARKSTILTLTVYAAALLLALAACAGNGGDQSGDPESSEDPVRNSRSAAWTPAPGTTWQWQLQDDIDTSLDVDVYDIDLFDVPQSTIDELHEAGRAVICYFSAGSLEEGREDAGRFQPSDAGNRLENWPQERWLDVRSASVRAIMEDRLDLAVAKGCDAVEPDNVDGFQNDNGLSFTADDQLDYNRFLAGAAHARGLSVGLKNALDLVDDLEPDFDWALNEECLAYDECQVLAPFLDAGKAVFHVEYVEDTNDGTALLAAVCDDPAVSGFSTLVKTPDLGAWRLACD